MFTLHDQGRNIHFILKFCGVRSFAKKNKYLLDDFPQLLPLVISWFVKMRERTVIGNVNFRCNIICNITDKLWQLPLPLFSSCNNPSNHLQLFLTSSQQFVSKNFQFKRKIAWRNLIGSIIYHCYFGYSLDYVMRRHAVPCFRWHSEHPCLHHKTRGVPNAAPILVDKPAQKKGN